MSETEPEKVFIGWEAAADEATGEPLVAQWIGCKYRTYPVVRALATARDLCTAAVAAENDKLLFELLAEGAGANPRLAVEALKHIRERRTLLLVDSGARPMLRIGAGYDPRSKRAFVALHSGSADTQRTPAEARQDASDLYQVATAAVLDARARYTLGSYGLAPESIAQFLADMRTLDRTATAFPPPEGP